MTTKTKFVCIASSPTTLNALDSSGDVWVYLGNNYGWKRINMKMLSERQAKQAMTEKYEESKETSPRNLIGRTTA